MTDNKKVSPAVEVARENSSDNGDGRIVTLSDGRKARLIPVSATLIDEVTTRIKDPEVPMIYLEEKGRSEPNPSDPIYLEKMSEANRERGIAAIDAMVMFGVELLDGVPEDGEWLKKLRFMEKRGQIELSSYDLEDSMDREFVYKRFIAVGNSLLERITHISGIGQEDIEQAERSFRGNSRR
jgi:hypothetical protein